LTLKLKYLSSVIVVLLLLILFAIQSKFNSSANSTLSLDPASFAIKDTSLVSRFEFGANVILKEGNTRFWRINNRYQVDELMLQSLFSVMQSLEIKRPVSEQSKEKILQSFADNGIEIKVYAGEELRTHFMLSAFEEDTYAMLLDDKKQLYSIYIPGFFVPIRDLFDINEQEWRNKTVMQTSWRSMKSLDLRYSQNPKNNLHIEYDSIFYKVQNVANLDTARLYSYIQNNYTAFRVESFLDNKNLQDSLQKAKPFCTITLKDLNPKNNNTLKIYQVNHQPYGVLENPSLLLALDPRNMGAILLSPQDFAVRR